MTEVKQERKVLELCADILEKDYGINPKQFFRYFDILSSEGYEHLLNVPENEYKNWFFFIDTTTNIRLLFNYKSKIYILLDVEEDWTDSKLEIFRKTEEELENEEKIYLEKMEAMRKSFIYQEIKPVITWYYSHPLKYHGVDTPLEYIQKLLEKFSKYYKIEGEDTSKLTELLFRVYHYEERL